MNAFKQILFLLAGCVASNISLVAADAPAKKDGTPAEWVDLVKKASTKIEGMIAELKKNKNYKDTTGTKTAVDAFATKFEDFKKEVVKVEEAKKTLDAKGKGEHKVETEAVVTAGETAITSLKPLLSSTPRPSRPLPPTKLRLLANQPSSSMLPPLLASLFLVSLPLSDSFRLLSSLPPPRFKMSHK
ncbi:GNAT family N-acetyltransferase [Babesia caballi]|uniref:GNAT family N-acetyltransferase n=1 Tax=Babesia caballi TaxID=5871 RepID=A0AAV4LW92_BABCB|nr:GNAT family N-acetyltransferase [Babesia caballi]